MNFFPLISSMKWKYLMVEILVKYFMMIRCQVTDMLWVLMWLVVEVETILLFQLLVVPQ